MNNIDFFKLQAKNFLKDYNNRIFDQSCETGIWTHPNPKFFNNIDEIIIEYDIDEDKPFSLMSAQHIIAQMAGFRNWRDLLSASDDRLELGKLILIELKKDYFSEATEVYDWFSSGIRDIHGNLIECDDSTLLDIFKARYCQ